MSTRADGEEQLSASDITSMLISVGGRVLLQGQWVSEREASRVLAALSKPTVCTLVSLEVGYAVRCEAPTAEHADLVWLAGVESSALSAHGSTVLRDNLGAAGDGAKVLVDVRGRRAVVGFGQIVRWKTDFIFTSPLALSLADPSTEELSEGIGAVLTIRHAHER